MAGSAWWEKKSPSLPPFWELRTLNFLSNKQVPKLKQPQISLFFIICIFRSLSFFLNYCSLQYLKAWNWHKLIYTTLLLNLPLRFHFGSQVSTVLGYTKWPVLSWWLWVFLMKLFSSLKCILDYCNLDSMYFLKDHSPDINIANARSN